MPYVLVHNNHVINGPRDWNFRSFESSIEEDVGITYKLPMQKTDCEPIIIDDNTKILCSTLVHPEHNTLIEFLHGPFWSFDDDLATGTFEIHQKSLDDVKAILISQTALCRYGKETANIKVTVQNQEVTVDAQRYKRDIFIKKYVFMEDTDVVSWKFPECWLDLSKEDVKTVAGAVEHHVQNQFEWERLKVDEINACTTVEELLNVVIE